ncbi:hypothetical protein NWP26_14350 [Chrysosporum ovalisporum APH033B]|nr:hypothetical protein [Umezakia ovalisporum]MDH6068387.1 hypothetical protein [Umezakia ovalisporum APH033B]MDH6081931.1 hypothetical protein [Umezakia ovalisporum FSS-44]
MDGCRWSFIFFNLISILDFQYSYMLGIFDMRHLFFRFLLLFGLAFVPGRTLATEYQSQPSLIQNLTSKPTSEKFYTQAARLVQGQIDLIAPIEEPTDPYPNPLGYVGGQLTI